MTQWTESAEQCFDDYCQRLRRSLDSNSVDADEVIDDLRRHIDEEAETSGLTVLDQVTLSQLLAKFGDPSHLDNSADTSTKTPEPLAKKADVTPKRPGYVLLFFGAILPAATLIFELLSGMSAGLLFDPIPTWFHVAMVAVIPFSNFILWNAARRNTTPLPGTYGWLNAIAIGSSIVYALLFIPFSPFAAFGIIYLGLGLLPLSPILALPATIFMRGRYRRFVHLEKLPGLAGGITIGIGILVLLNAQTFLTYRGIANASNPDAETSRDGVRLLRATGDEELLLRVCYRFVGGVGMLDPIRYLAMGHQNVSTGDAREIYYRVTGRSFNSRRPPSLYNRSGRWRELDEEFTWDSALGGDQVAGRVKGLSMTSSRLDAVAEPDAATVYSEWTMEFKNVHTTQREARAQIALPPGGVVSRLALWVNGEEREAAFAGRSAVKEAYRKVAVVRRRDPVLVTTAGPDRILMQCFPVPPNGGSMKIRMGITAPLVLDSLEQGEFHWPRILERNFSMQEGLSHSLWLDSPEPIQAGTGNISDIKENLTSWQASINDYELASNGPTVTITRDTGSTVAWTPAMDPGHFIHQTIQVENLPAPTHIVLALDGSAGMEQYGEEILKALSSSESGASYSLAIATDDPDLLARNQNAQTLNLETVLAEIEDIDFEGGQDNLPALVDAWQMAAKSPSNVVIWIHAPQAVKMKSPEVLRQLVERSAGSIPIYELQTGNGADRLIEAMDGLPNIHHVSRSESLQKDISNLIGKVSGQIPVYTYQRTLTNEQPTEGQQAGSRHIERLWALEEITKRLAAGQTSAAIQLAGLQQLVTPCSGAVVLENQQQYEENNLTPVDEATVPSIPEPTTILLLIIGLSAMVWSSKRRQRRTSVV